MNRKEEIIKASGNTYKEVPGVVNNQAQPSNRNEERRREIFKQVKHVGICHKCKSEITELDNPFLTLKEVESILAQHKCSEPEYFSEKQILENTRKQDEIIKNLEQENEDLKATINDLDYLLNSGRNKFENQRNKRLKELEKNLNQPLTNQELLLNLIQKLASEELVFCFEDEDNKLFLEEKATKQRIYLFSLKIEDGANISVFAEDGKVWQAVNDKFRAEYFDNDEFFLQETPWKKGTVRILDESEKPAQEKEAKLIQIQGILTTEVRFKSKDKVWMAFLRWQYSNREVKHVDAELCANAKCQECEIPVIFRKEHSDLCIYVNYCALAYNEIKPTLEKGDKVLLEGNWANSSKSSRPSFTCSSYQIINDNHDE